MTPEQKSSRDVPEGFAICTGRIPNKQHGSKERTHELKVVGTYPEGMTPEQKSSRDVPGGDGPRSRKVVGDVLEGDDP
ncbi:hypothetical protein CRG98_001993 [Punica granatum]|uniref:Uncharacterized protein n=1 Tax=Punica granatum TaxID=22663 RepID=A0A2I0LA96_PUNGR|nr:hypothetical protein CRG98_001993 [Punica granatum]